VKSFSEISFMNQIFDENENENENGLGVKLIAEI
jgi:hypothetical protein